MDVNHFLISSLLERWRLETHTFHFPHGETTVTLKDVAILLGLPIDKDVVTGPTTVQDIFSTFHEYLGVIPPPTVIRGNSIRVTWLNTTFQQLPPNANNDVIAQYARAYILTLIGSILMQDTSVARVHVVATGIATGRRIEKRNGFKKDLGVTTIIILENYGKP